MLQANYPYIIRLYFTFQDSKHFYYGMELLTGGTLLKYIRDKKRVPEEEAKFFAA